MPTIRQEVEAILTCPKCGRACYKVWRQETGPDTGVFRHFTQPLGDDFEPTPGITAGRRECWRCGVECQRRAP